MAFPGHADAATYVKQWQQFRPRQTPYLLGWGYGADLGGLSEQPAPSSDGGGIAYPFKSLDGRVTFQRQRTGDRTFDYTKDGVAHYGLYADWFEDLRRLGGAKLARDMWNGAEAYLEMWERAEGIRAPGCAASRGAVGPRGLGRLRLGLDWRALLRRAGQPQQRARAWSWCVRGRGNRRAADVAVLSPAGRVELVGSTARGRSVGGVRVGARGLGNGVHVRGASIVVVLRGRVRAVAVASRALAGRPRALRADVRRLLAARASQARRVFRPSAAQAATAGRVTGRALAGTSDPALNAALAFLCGLEVQGGGY
jgi:hypothetical protein